MTDLIDPQTAATIASTLAVAARYDELASSQMHLADTGAKITMTPYACRELAKLLRNHASMLKHLTGMHHIQKVRADSREDQLVRALVLLRQVERFSVMEFLMFRRQARKDHK